MMRVRPREIRELSQGLTASVWQTCGLDPGLTPDLSAFNHSWGSEMTAFFK